MERLTFDGNFCDISQCEATPGGSFCEDGTCSMKEVWERLKEYEDTGYAPDALVTVGHVVPLKARVGDTLWLTASYYTERLPQPMEARVVRIKIDAGDAITYATTKRRVNDKEIGKTVFLSREEAKKALEARNGD